MSVARNSFSRQPYYDWKLYDITSRGMSLTHVRHAAASPTMAIAVGSIVANAVTTLRFLKSTNGIDWSPITSAPNTAIYAIAYGNNTFVAVGAAGAIYTSPGTDGNTWTARTKAGSSVNPFAAISFTNGYFIAMQRSVAGLNYSTDGITWTLSSDAGQGTSFTNTSRDFDQYLAPRQSFVYWNGLYYYFMEQTSTTSSPRIFISKSIDFPSATSSTLAISNGSYLSFVRGDLGDNLGITYQVPSTTGQNVVTRANLKVNGQVSTAWDSASIGNNLASGNNLSIFGSSLSVTGISFTAGSSAAAMVRLPVFYINGYYQFVWPVTPNAAPYTIATSSQAAIAVGTFNESDMTPVRTAYGTNKIVRILGNSQISSTSQWTNGFENATEFTLNNKQYILMSYGPQQQGTFPRGLLEGSFAIRPLRTTIDYAI